MSPTGKPLFEKWGGHGRPSRYASYATALHNFPEKEGELFPSDYKHAEEHLFALYEQVKERLDASVDYWTWNNINRFMMAAAEALKKAVYDPFFTDDLGH